MCFYPGDIWDLKTNVSNYEPLKKYANDYNKIDILPLNEKKIYYDELKNSSDKFISTIKRKNNLFNIYNFFYKNQSKIFFTLTDTKENYFFDFKKGLISSNDIFKDDPWCSLSSQSLKNLFTSGYGYDALIIGGRFESNKEGLGSLDRIFKFQAKNYHNIYYNFNTLINKMFYRLFNKSSIFHKR